MNDPNNWTKYQLALSNKNRSHIVIELTTSLSYNLQPHRHRTYKLIVIELTTSTSTS